MTRKLLFVLLLLNFSTLPGLCAPRDTPKTTLTPVTLQLKWRHAFQFAGFYVADFKGYYADAGLKVTIKERKDTVKPLTTLIKGNADYALVNGSALLMSYLQGNPVRALAVIFQHSPNILMSRRDSGIRTPVDLIGKKVMLSKGLSTLEFTAMFIHEGMDPHAIAYTQPSLQLDDLAEGRVDAINTYITSGPFELNQRGIKASFLKPVNYGVDFYGDTLATTADELRNHPKRVQAFTKASLKGWQYAFEHPGEVIAYILTLPDVQNRPITTEALSNEAQEMIQLIQPKFVELGHINPGRFSHMAKTFVDLGLIEPDYSLDDFIYSPNRKIKGKWPLILLISSSLFLVLACIGWLVNRHLARTITERTREYRESEQRFNDLVTLLPEMVWESDLEGKLTYVNQAALEHFGQASSFPDQDLYCLKMLVPKDRKNAAEIMKQVGQGKETGLNEYTALTGTGSTFPVWIRSSPIIKDEKIIGLRGIVIDISERRKLEEQLNQAQKMEAIGTLAGGIAHDFNNILTAILGYTELASLHMGDDNRVRQDLDHVRTGAIRARDLVAQILAFSRKSDKQVSKIFPALIVKEALKLLRSSTPSTIAFEQHVNSKSRIEIDPTQFHQIMMNICTNSIQAMAEHGGVLSVKLTDKEVSKDPLPLFLSSLPPGPYICLEIADNGEGMTDATQEKIFEPYFTTKALGKGTGLGLAVVHGIVKNCKGDIHVKSSPGEGTCFQIFLPIIPPSVSIPKENSSQNRKVAPQFQGQGERILLIDDEEELVVMLKGLLLHSGYEVDAFRDSKLAWHHYSQHSLDYDLILTDMTMPRMTGLELSEKCLAMRKDQPIILMTGFSEQINKQKATNAGIRCLIQKPPETDFLLKTVWDLLNAK